jgi:Peroxidase
MKLSLLIIFVGFTVHFATGVESKSSQRQLETSEDTINDSSLETNATSNIGNEGTNTDSSSNDESVSSNVRSTVLSILDDTRNSLLAFYSDDEILASDEKKIKRNTTNGDIGPTRSPIKFRSRPPSKKPTRIPTGVPSSPPFRVPPSTQPAAPTLAPKATSTRAPTPLPTRTPTPLPTPLPTRLPTDIRTLAPTRLPTLAPTPLPKPTSRPTSKPTGKPTNIPTIQPNLPTNKAPTGKPTISPTVTPTRLPTSPPSRPSTTRSPIIVPSLDVVIEQAKLKIRETIMINPFIAANYVRLGFHDCVPSGSAGGCDGCLNLISNDENAGLQPSVDALAPIVTELEPLGLSRADIWALAVLVAADMSQSEMIFSDAFQPGRVNCEIAGTCQFSDSDPSLSALCSTHGPDSPADFPSTIFTTHELIAFMGDHFGFNADQTVAIMGAHTLGRALPENSGYEGRNGWVLNHTVLGKLKS